MAASPCFLLRALRLPRLSCGRRAGPPGSEPPRSGRVLLPWCAEWVPPRPRRHGTWERDCQTCIELRL